jgi:transposase
MWDAPLCMVYLQMGHQDIRESISGLARVVADTLGLDSLSKCQ